jgi:hypothetical protein
MTMTRTRGVDKALAISLVDEVLERLQEVTNGSKNPMLHDLDQFFTTDFHLVNNSQTICRSLADYTQRIKKIKRKYAKVTVTNALEEPLFTDNKLAFRFNINFFDGDGHKTVVNFMAIATIENNHKISHWIQVSHEKSPFEWDS